MVKNNSKGAANTAPAFNLRPINANDVFLMAKIIRNIGISDFLNSFDTNTIQALAYKSPTKMEGGEVVPLPRKEWTDGQRAAELAALEVIGNLDVKVVDVLLSHLPECKGSLFQLLAESTGTSIDEIQNMGAIEFIDLLDRYIGREEFSDFFTAAARLMGSSRGLNISMQSTDATQTQKKRSTKHSISDTSTNS